MLCRRNKFCNVVWVVRKWSIQSCFYWNEILRFEFSKVEVMNSPLKRGENWSKHKFWYFPPKTTYESTFSQFFKIFTYLVSFSWRSGISEAFFWGHPVENIKIVQPRLDVAPSPSGLRWGSPRNRKNEHVWYSIFYKVHFNLLTDHKESWHKSEVPYELAIFLEKFNKNADIVNHRENELFWYTEMYCLLDRTFTCKGPHIQRLEVYIGNIGSYN